MHNVIFMYKFELCRSDEPLLSHIPLPFCVHLDGYLVLNFLLLVHFHQLGLIGQLFRNLINLTLISLIFYSNYFLVFM